MKYNYLILVATDQYSQKLLNLLRQVRSQSKIDIVVVFNGKDCEEQADKLSKSLTDLSGLELLTIKKRGKSAALNHAIESFRKDSTFIIFTDDDIEVNPSWIKNYIDAVESKGKNTIYGSGVYVSYEAFPEEKILQEMPPSAKGVRDDEISGGMFYGCNWGTFAEDILEAGGFDERFGPGSTTGATGQETQMMRKLMERGNSSFTIKNNYVLHHVPKEKCRIKWVLHRSYRNGIAYGISSRFNVFKELIKIIWFSLIGLSGGLRSRISRSHSMGKLRGCLYRQGYGK